MITSNSNVYRLYKRISLAFVFVMFGLLCYGVRTLSNEPNVSKLKVSADTLYKSISTPESTGKNIDKVKSPGDQ